MIKLVLFYYIKNYLDISYIQSKANTKSPQLVLLVNINSDIRKISHT